MTNLPPPPGAPPPPPPPTGGGEPPPPPGGQPQPPGGAAEPAVGQQAPMYANFGQRLGAWLLDGLILGIPATIGFFVLIVVLPRGEPELCTDFDGDLAICEPLTGGSFMILLVAGLAMLVFVVYYWWGKLIGERGQTPGKKAVHIKVVGRNTNQPVGMGKGIGRGLMSYVSSLICYLGYFWMLWDDKKQTWHDKVVESIVIVES